MDRGRDVTQPVRVATVPRKTNVRGADQRRNSRPRLRQALNPDDPTRLPNPMKLTNDVSSAAAVELAAVLANAGAPEFQDSIEAYEWGNQVKRNAKRVRQLEQAIKWALMHLDTNIDSDGNPMKDSDAAKCLRETQK